MVNNQNFPFVPGQGGRLAVDRFDFQSHVDGAGFRHTADQIDTLNPSQIINNDTTVEQALEDLSTLPAIISGLGTAYISVPDGYNAWHNANGSVMLDPTVPFLDTFLNPIFARVGPGGTLPAAYARLQYGGVVFIPAGTYMVQNPINVPPGITLLGEGYGTKLVNVSSIKLPTHAGGAISVIDGNSITAATNTTPIEITLNTPSPSLQDGQMVIITGVSGNTAANNTAGNPFWIITVVDNQHIKLRTSVGSGAYSGGGMMHITRSVLNILPDTNRIGTPFADDVAISGGSNPFMFARSTNIFNMVISDNFVEPTILGDLQYTNPQNLTNSIFTAPALITQQQGSNLILENVVGAGRVKFSSGTTVSSATTSFINTSSPALPSGAILGTYLSINNCIIDGFAIPFQFAGLGGSLDYFSLTNSKVRSYGYLAGDSSDATNNTFLNTSDSNIVISNNSLYGNDVNITSVIMISQVAGSVPPNQGRSKLVSDSNNIIINPAGTTGNNIFSFYYPNPSIGNINSYINIAGHSSSITASQSPVTINTPATCPPYTSSPQMADTSTGAITFFLPDATVSDHTVIIKDIGGQAHINNITITPMTGQSIDGGTPGGNYIYATRYGSITLTSLNGNWWSI